MKTKYTVDWFIKKLGAIPASNWCENVFKDEKGRCCALGHLGVRDNKSFETIPAALSLMILFDNVAKIEGNYNFGVIWVNNGYSALFPQKGPKTRIMAALKFIKEKLNE